MYINYIVFILFKCESTLNVQRLTKYRLVLLVRYTYDTQIFNLTCKIYDFLYRLTSEKSSFVRRFNEKNESNGRVLENTTKFFTTQHTVIKRPIKRKFFLKPNGLCYRLENKCNFQYFHIVASVHTGIPIASLWNGSRVFNRFWIFRTTLKSTNHENACEYAIIEINLHRTRRHPSSIVLGFIYDFISKI